MKKTINFTSVLGLPVLFLIQMLLACTEHDISPETSKEYFLLDDHTQLDYLMEYISTGDNETIWYSDTVTLTVLGDTLVEGISYKKIVNEYGFLEKIVRNESTQYFGRNHELYGGFSNEYMFLDTKVRVDSSWDYIKDGGNTKTEYVVKKAGANLTVNGVEYKDVIELDVNYYNNYTDGINLELWLSAKHYYAKGIGEIYAYYPPTLSGMYNNVRISLLPVEQK